MSCSSYIFGRLLLTIWMVVYARMICKDTPSLIRVKMHSDVTYVDWKSIRVLTLDCCVVQFSFQKVDGYWKSIFQDWSSLLVLSFRSYSEHAIDLISKAFVEFCEICSVVNIPQNSLWHSFHYNFLPFPNILFIRTIRELFFSVYSQHCFIHMFFSCTFFSTLY